MSKINTLHQTSSEVNTLATRGYRLLNKLGEGSYAKVYLGEYRSTSDTAPATLACKVIDTKKVTKNFLNKFLPRELDVLVKINHPHIIHVHSIFQRRTKYYIFMRYAENGDLLDFILKDGAISEPQTRFWVRQIALALQYLHRMQIAHRDIKCENILVTSNNNVKLCDFGFTRYVVDAQNRRVLSETFCGSLSYAAPEILKGLAYAPKISDMWALGVLVFTMLNKAMPFDDTHATQLYENQIRKRWKFGYRVVDRLSSEVKSMVKRLLEPDVKKRLRIDDVIAHSWFAMDARLKNLNQYEMAAYRAAVKSAPAIDDEDTAAAENGATNTGQQQHAADAVSKKRSNDEESTAPAPTATHKAITIPPTMAPPPHSMRPATPPPPLKKTATVMELPIVGECRVGMSAPEYANDSEQQHSLTEPQRRRSINVYKSINTTDMDENASRTGG